MYDCLSVAHFLLAIFGLICPKMANPVSFLNEVTYISVSRISRLQNNRISRLQNNISSVTYSERKYN